MPRCVSCPRIGDSRLLSVQHKFVTNSKALMAAGRDSYPDQPYRIMTDVGEVVVLPPRFAEEIRNNPALSLARAMEVVRKALGMW